MRPLVMESSFPLRMRKLIADWHLTPAQLLSGYKKRAQRLFEAFAHHQPPGDPQAAVN